MSRTEGLIQQMENYCEANLGEDENTGVIYFGDLPITEDGRAHGGKVQCFKERT